MATSLGSLLSGADVGAHAQRAFMIAEGVAIGSVASAIFSFYLLSRLQQRPAGPPGACPPCQCFCGCGPLPARST